MAWEKRKRGGLYYTRSLKVDGRVLREYVGPKGDPLAELTAQVDLLERCRREGEAAAWKEGSSWRPWRPVVDQLLLLSYHRRHEYTNR
jgi:hypothetical protein